MNSFLKFKKKTIISGKGVQIMDWERVRGGGGGGPEAGLNRDLFCIVSINVL